MAVDDFLDSHVVIAVAGTAVAFSPRARRLLRRGAVYGLAGVLMAGDAIGSFTRAAARGARDAAPVMPAATTAEAPVSMTGTADAGS